ncbi:hypothetical protein F0562_028123 [Nyssa sinensis]|uniref:Uncharacterized protein n=1 Tax=Nyssa sinensis TaxID=561372 RepID=A0A5J5B855_9ASTE|nr:hypothetical protein F0562_028123 [Nyssa sinensis]
MAFDCKGFEYNQDEDDVLQGLQIAIKMKIVIWIMRASVSMMQPPSSLLYPLQLSGRPSSPILFERIVPVGV